MVSGPFKFDRTVEPPTYSDELLITVDWTDTVRIKLNIIILILTQLSVLQ